MSKEIAHYNHENDPTAPGVTHVMVQPGQNGSIVWAAYVHGQVIPDSVRESSSGELLELEVAMTRFRFEPFTEAENNPDQIRVGQTVEYQGRAYKVETIDGDQATIYTPKRTHEITDDELQGQWTVQMIAEHCGGTIGIAEGDRTITWAEDRQTVNVSNLKPAGYTHTQHPGKKIAETVMTRDEASVLRATCIGESTKVSSLVMTYGRGVTNTIQRLIDLGYLNCDREGTIVWQTQKTKNTIQL